MVKLAMSGICGTPATRYSAVVPRMQAHAWICFLFTQPLGSRVASILLESKIIHNFCASKSHVSRAVRRNNAMKTIEYLVLLLAAVLLLPLATLASDNNQRTVDIADPVQVGNVHLKAGTYKVEWNLPGPKVEVTFLHHGKEVATAPATVKTQDRQITQDDFETHKNSANVNVLDEIDFAHGHDALVFTNHGTAS